MGRGVTHGLKSNELLAAAACCIGLLARAETHQSVASTTIWFEEIPSFQGVWPNAAAREEHGTDSIGASPNMVGAASTHSWTDDAS